LMFRRAAARCLAELIKVSLTCVNMGLCVNADVSRIVR
jgi:hypothetical protein